MGYLTVDCVSCGGSWHVYHARGHWSDDITRTCPHCFAEIDRQTWENQVLPAFGGMSDANRELARDSTGQGKPLFRVHYTEDQETRDPRVEEIRALNDRLGELEERMAGCDMLAAILEGEL